MTPSGGVASTTLTVKTATTTAALPRNSNPLLPGSALALALCCFGWRKRRRLQIFLLLAVSVAGLSIFTGCNAASSSTPQPVTSTVTVTATAGSAHLHDLAHGELTSRQPRKTIEAFIHADVASIHSLLIAPGPSKPGGYSLLVARPTKRGRGAGAAEGGDLLPFRDPSQYPSSAPAAAQSPAAA